jgi:hypothetical protein
MQINETSFGKWIKTHKMRRVIDKYDPFNGMNVWCISLDESEIRLKELCDECDGKRKFQ